MRSLRTNRLALVVAFLVGLLYVAPQFFFIFDPHSNFQGIPLMPSPNEAEYVYQIHSILDGDYLSASPLYYEYKKQTPMMLPVGEYFYALPVLVLGISLVAVLVISKFILPVILFLLIYFLFQQLLDDAESVAGKISSLAGAIFIVVGYDLVDFRTIFRLLSGHTEVLNSFSFLWARPVNPVIGGICLFSFLLLISVAFRRRASRWWMVGVAAVLLALMFGNYFFSWGLAISVLAVLTIFVLLKKNYALARGFVLIPVLSLVLSAPYWWLIWRAKMSPWYQESVLRHGLMLTHYPLINKFLVLTALLFILTVCVPRWRRLGWRIALNTWQWFALALMGGALLAYNQQVITGRTIWPFHFSQYSIPFCIIVLVLLLHNEIRPRARWVWQVAVGVIILASSVYGVYAQAASYQTTAAYYAGLQAYMPALRWLDERPGDCVVLVNFNNEKWHDLTALIAGFTHCDIYARDWHFSMMPFERSLDDYMIQLRWQGISAQDIESYIRSHNGEATGYLFSNWKSLYGVSQFPDFSDPEVTKRIQAFPGEYRDYMSRDMKTVLTKYRLDYIVSVGPMKQSLAGQLKNLKMIFQSGELFIYSF